MTELLWPPPSPSLVPPQGPAEVLESLTAGRCRVLGQDLEDAPIYVGSFLPHPKIHSLFLFSLANMCQAYSIMQTSGNAKSILVPAFKAQEAIMAPSQTGARIFDSDSTDVPAIQGCLP